MEVIALALTLLFFWIPQGPFVKVSLMLAGRQMKKTKTSVARNTLLPVYNEAFVFDVPIDRLSDVSLLVRVLNTHQRDGRRPQTRTIGKTIVGPDAQTSIGLHHWNCMMTTPRKPIAQWHPLVKTWLTINNIIRKFTNNASETILYIPNTSGVFVTVVNWTRTRSNVI